MGTGEMILQIKAPHFTAGVVLRAGRVGLVLVTEAAPIVKYMKGWSEGQVREYCARKKWKVT